MRILELFDRRTAFPIEWDKGPGVTYARSTVPIGDKQVELDITFADIDNGIIDIEFAVGGRYSITGTGGVGPVFATVVNACKQFVADHPKINTITFTAGEQSRARMYDTIAKRVSKEIGWHVIPYDEMISNPSFRYAARHGDFVFALQRGQAPASRQAAQQPQHGDFLPVFYVYAYENPDLPAIRIQVKNGQQAEEWVIKNIPGYDKEHPMSIFATKAPPKDRKVIDKGTLK